MAELLDRKHVTVRELAGAMDVSEATVRRDLRALADRRRLTLVHGGAALPRDLDFSVQAKQMRNTDAKRVIGELAAELVDDGEQLFVDSGTTCFEMARSLSARRGLSVIANSTRLVTDLHAPGLSYIMLGGQYRPERMDTIGPVTTSTLEQLRGYRAFIGADGLSMDFGPSAADIESAHLYRLAVANARETVLLVDHSKFQSASLFKIVDWPLISRLVCDRRPDPRWCAFLDEHGIDTIYPDKPARAHAAPAHAGVRPDA